MKTRTAYYLLAIAWVSLALTSCLKDQEDYFEEPSSERMANTMQRVQQILRSAEYGWEFEYYPSSDLAYGGIVYTVKFDSLTATVSCSLVPDSTYTSYYRMTNDNGPVLTFDTYNPLLHYFSTPSSGEYEAKGGEFEFVIDSIANDQITLYGKKTRNTMYLRRLTANPDEYTKKTIDIYDNFVERLTGNIGSAEVEGKFNLKNKSLQIVSGGDTLTNHFTYTDYGIRFYRPIRLGGAAVQSFGFDVETQQLTCRDPGYENITLQGIPFDENTMAFKDYEGNYILRYANGNSSVRVAIELNRIDGSLLLTGLSPHYDLRVTYDYETGDLSLTPQVIGEVNGRIQLRGWQHMDYGECLLQHQVERQQALCRLQLLAHGCQPLQLRLGPHRHGLLQRRGQADSIAHGRRLMAHQRQSVAEQYPLAHQAEKLIPY